MKSISILDWQIARYCPPVLDLLYNIFSSTDKPFRDRYYSKLVDTYHTSLSATIRKLGSDPELYSYETLQQQLRKFGDFTLLCAPLIISIRVAIATNSSGDNDGSTDKREKILSNIHSSGETQTEYSRLINELLIDLVNYGYVDLNSDPV